MTRWDSKAGGPVGSSKSSYTRVHNTAAKTREILPPRLGRWQTRPSENSSLICSCNHTFTHTHTHTHTHTQTCTSYSLMLNNILKNNWNKISQKEMLCRTNKYTAKKHSATLLALQHLKLYWSFVQASSIVNWMVKWLHIGLASYTNGP